MTRDELRTAIIRAATFRSRAEGGTCGYLLNDSQVEAIMQAAERYADADRKVLDLVRDLAASWTADDGWGTATPAMETQADCGREVLAITGEPAPDLRPTPYELWVQAKENPDDYRRLLREHGHILRPGDAGYDPDAPRTLPCGWSPGKAKPGGGGE